MPKDSLEVPVTGQMLLEQSLWNKGTAFTRQERRELRLLGLLPPHVDTMEEQLDRCYEAYRKKESPIVKHIFLRNLQDENETLFYGLVLRHVREMMPVIYTPVVGEACQRFSHIYRRPRGLFISYAERDRIDEILDNCALPRVEVIVVTDGERILGLGDQGAGGMGIPIGKLSLYTAIGGIHPAITLPVMLDVGTNNPELLDDPRYIGWRHERISGAAYEEFIETFVAAVTRKFPGVLLQWEDFATRNAEPILNRYRDRLCTFNDDIQGTAAVATGTLMAAVKVIGGTMCDQRIVMLGSGSAGVGICGQLARAMVEDGLGADEARGRFFVIDSQGLIHDGRPGLTPLKQSLAQKRESLAQWECQGDVISLLDTVRQARPTILIGATGRPGIISERVVRTMAEQVPRPIIFPLSNPTSRCEALPKDLIEWTDGRALVATGSPFDPVTYRGHVYPIAQCNNSYVFPAMGLGIRAANASRVTDEMFMVAAKALRDRSPMLTDPNAPLLPDLENVREVVRHIAIVVGAQAQREGVAETTSPEELQQRVGRRMWTPTYLPTRYKGATGM
ncbi:MAG: NAD-dependent malic enzyme [Pirellulales bacterium]